MPRPPAPAVPGVADEPGAESRLDSGEVRARAGAAVVTVVARNLVVRVLGLLGNIVLARLLVPSDFGIVSLGLTVTMLGSMLASAGLGAALMRRAEPPGRPVLGAVLGFQLAVTLVVVALVGAVGVAAGGAGPVVALMALALPIDALRIPTGIMAERGLDFRVTARAEVIEMVVYNLAAIALVVAGLGVWGVAVAVILRAAVGSAVLIATGPVGLLAPRLDWPEVREIWRFGIRFQLVGFVNVGREQGVNVAAAAVGGLAVLGVWSLAYRLLQAVLLLFQALWRVSFPAMARLLETGEEHAPLLRRGIGLAALAAGVPAVAIAGTAPALVPTLFGAGWDGVIGVLPWGAAALMVSGPVSTACIGYLYAIGKAGAVLAATGAQAVVWLVVGAGLIDPLGAEAVGIGMLAGAATLAAGLLLALRGTVRIVVPPLVGPSLLAAALGAGAAWPVAQRVDPPALALAASLVVAEAIFLGLSLLLQRERVRNLLGIVRRATRGALAGRT